jgi:hypothetical protein
LQYLKVIWVPWRYKGISVMWPALAERVKKENGHTKVSFKYYESETKFSKLFNKELSQIELFFRPVRQHLHYKVDYNLIAHI